MRCMSAYVTQRTLRSRVRSYLIRRFAKGEREVDTSIAVWHRKYVERVQSLDVQLQPIRRVKNRRSEACAIQVCVIDVLVVGGFFVLVRQIPP